MIFFPGWLIFLYPQAHKNFNHASDPNLKENKLNDTPLHPAITF